MIFWILVAVLSAGVTYWVTRPLLSGANDPVEPAAADIVVYKDQLAEIDADLSRGQISQAEAEARARRSFAQTPALERYSGRRCAHVLAAAKSPPEVDARCRVPSIASRSSRSLSCVWQPDSSRTAAEGSSGRRP